MSRVSLQRTFALVALVMLLAVLFLILQSARQDAVAGHAPADKVAAAGSTTQVFGPGTEVTLLSTQLRTATPTDLILQASAECSLVTNVTTVGNDDQQAFGEVRVWVEIDGEPVPVSTGDESGKVVFCNRAYRRQTTMFDDQDATIRTFVETRTANAFNWLDLNLGNGIHTVELKADLTETASPKALAEAVVGNRTLIVEPAKLPVDATVDGAG